MENSIEAQGTKLYLLKNLDFVTVNDVYKQSLNYFSKLNELHFDFSKVDKANSAAIALIVEWIKLGKKSGKNTYFENLPENLQTIIKMSGLDVGCM